MGLKSNHRISDASPDTIYIISEADTRDDNRDIAMRSRDLGDFVLLKLKQKFYKC